MSSDSRHHRPLLLPGADFGRLVIPVTSEGPRTWFRIHRIDLSPTDFTTSSHHRFSHPKCPYPLLYVGGSLQTCLWEIFGDDVFLGKRVISQARWEGRCVSEIIVPSLELCALTLVRTRDAIGVDKASLMAQNLAIPQAWGLAIQRHPAGFHGIRYSSRFINRSCMALFDRNGLPARLKAKRLGGLSASDTAVNWLDEHRITLA